MGRLEPGKRVKRALQKMIDEKAIPLKKDYALIMVALSDINDLKANLIMAHLSASILQSS